MSLDKTRWHKTFLGVTQQHTYWLYKVIDQVMVANPQLHNFIEIGTGNGALSVILGLHACQRNTFLTTIDIHERTSLEKLQTIFAALEIDFVLQDCFEYLPERFGEYPVFLMCDGGDKVKEFNTFAPMLPRGSVIAAHDYGVEIKAEDIKETVKKLKLKPLFEQEWRREPDDIQCCFYKVPL